MAVAACSSSPSRSSSPVVVRELVQPWARDGREIGSISAAIFTCSDGKPNGAWKATPMHSPTPSPAAEGEHPRLSGFVESVPGMYVGVMLTWRSKRGNLPSSWKNEQDLYAYYFIDGRPHPVMEYSILQPGAKNPLPLSGLWKSDNIRFPLRWRPRPAIGSSAAQEVDNSLFLPLPNDTSYPYDHALASVDDLSSIRISIHDKNAEDERVKKKSRAAITGNKTRPKGDTGLFADHRLSDTIELGGTEGERPSAVYNLLSTSNDLPRSVPILEFRIYYKSRAILENLGLAPRLTSDIDTHASLPSENAAQHVASVSNESIASAEPSHRPTKRVKREAVDDSALMEVDVPSHSPSFPANPSNSTSKHPSHAPDSSLLTQRSYPALNSVQRASAAPSSSTPAGIRSSATLASSPSAGALAERMPSASAVPKAEESFSQPFPQSQPSSGAAAAADRKRQAAYEFLQEAISLDGDDPEGEEEMVQALLSVGFRTKAKFLNNMKACDDTTRNNILDSVKPAMGMVDHGAFVAYLKRECGF